MDEFIQERMKMYGLSPAKAKQKAKTKKVSHIKEQFIRKVMEAISAKPKGGKRAKPKRKISPKMKQRNDLIRKIMQKTGCSLVEASRFIKDQGLM